MQCGARERQTVRKDGLLPPVLGPGSFSSHTGDRNTLSSQTFQTKQTDHCSQLGVYASKVMFYVHMAMYRFWLGAWGRRERHLLWCTSVLLNFEPYEWLKYKNKYKGYALGRRKVVPDGGLDFRKERRGMEGEIRANTNESWLHKTMKLMFKI